MSRPRELITTVTAKNCRFETFRAGGSGGQNQNTRDTGARCIHPPSGAVGEARNSRKQIENKRAAFKRMAETKEFKTWAQMEGLELQPVSEIVDQMMKPDNLKIEYV